MSKVVKRLASLISEKIVGIDGSKVFKGRYSLEFPDYEFIESAQVKKDQPYMAMVIASQKYDSAYTLADKKEIQTVSDIIHAGSSTASYSISGDHRGNNDFLLKITVSGSLGVAEYQLSKDNGETFEDSQVIPESGQVEIGDGTILTFGSEGNLVVGETYSWVTISMSELTYCTDTFIIKTVIQIYTADGIELFGDDNFTGYQEQVRDFITENRAIHDGSYIYRINLDQKAQPYSDTRNDLYRGLTSVIIEGALYYKKQIPLIGKAIAEVGN